jgi:CRP/FNR family transcriptional regulator, nitrogen oxide reductase regulator
MRLKKRAVVAALPPGFKSTFLDALTPREVRALLKGARSVKISHREVLQQDGEPARRLWLLWTGRVAVYRLTRDGNKLFLRWGAPGDVFGLATIVRAPARYLVTIEAVQGGSILAWDLAACQALISQCPSLGKAVNWAVSKYLESLIDMLAMCQMQTAEERLARVLVESAGQLGHSGPEGIEVDLKNEEMALAAHMSIFTATRHLSKWQRAGLLKKYRGKIVLPSLSPFEKITSDFEC